MSEPVDWIVCYSAVGKDVLESEQSVILPTGVVVANEVLIVDWTPGRRLRIKAPGRYSMDVAIDIQRWIEGLDRCSIAHAGWKSAGCGNLVERGITVRLDSIRFRVMCSYDDLFIERIDGNNIRFTTLCEAIQRKLKAN